MEFILSKILGKLANSRNLLLGLAFAVCCNFACSTSDSKNYQQEVQNWFTSNQKVKILATTEMINDLVKNIGGEHVDSIALIQGQLDPHSYQLVKGDDEKISFADLIFYNGLGLEHGPSLQKALVMHPKAFPLGDLIQQHNPRAILKVNGQLDPHIWMDVSLWSEAIPFIVAELSKQDPRHAKEYAANGNQLQTLMQKTHGEIKTELQAIPNKQRYLVTSHDAFNYFTRAYLATSEELADNRWQERFAAPEGLAPESQLSTANIKQIIDHLQQYDIHVLFPESNVSKDSIKKIVAAGKEKGLDVAIAQEPLYGDAMGGKESDGATYLGMMKHNARVISNNLRSVHAP